MGSNMKRYLFVLGLLFSQLLCASSDPFPRPAELEPDVRFWVRVYSEVDTSSGFIHDSRNLGVVYETLQLPEELNHTAQMRLVNQVRERYQQALRELASGRSDLSAEARRIRALWPENTPAQRFQQAADDIRFQRGQANRFRDGLVRSGLWRAHILEVLERYGLPKELVVVPHVESSFNPSAYSHAAAAGLWQFMPATGREFMQVNHIIDERLDPYLATDGAARLLKRNFDSTGNWPLAVTAYNHGANGVRRAVQTVGSDDIATIVRRYQGPAFGFASRNFYVSFLAALEIDRHPEKYFGEMALALPTQYDVIEMPAYVAATTLVSALGTDLATLQQYNPALRTPIWKGEKFIPRGYSVRLPKGTLQQPASQLVAAIPSAQRFASQNPDRFHRVASGESLSVIARRHGTNVRELMALNALSSEHHIRAGAQLRLPGAATIEMGMQVAGSGGAYRVRQGDSLWLIANRHSTTVAALRAANNLGERSHIVAGQELRLPGPGRRTSAASAYHTVRPGDSLWSIANRHGISVSALSSMNALDGRHTIRPGQRLRLPVAGSATQTASVDEQSCAPAIC